MRFKYSLTLLLFSLLIFSFSSCKKDEPNEAPSCSILLPSEGDTINVGTLVEISVSASDADGRIASVSIQVDDIELKEFTTSPYKFYWNTDSVSAGWKNLKASALDDDDEETHRSIDIFLRGNTAPMASFVFTPDSGNVSQLFSFDASTSSDIEDPLSSLTFRWDWENDGVFDISWTSNPMATHTFNTPGVYDVKLEVKDSKGLIASLIKPLKVMGSVLQAPIASFTLSPDSGDLQTTFTVNAGASYDPDGAMSALQFRWDWNGDGSYDSPFVSDTLGAQIYVSAGIYRIVLQVRDADGLTDTTSKIVIVSDPGPGWQSCPGIPTLNYLGKSYQTLLIGNQCWFRENLDAGTMLNSAVGQQNNMNLEKYCYNNNIVNCNVYGGLYSWDEAMNYASAAQGICPSGWHIATDDDFKYAEAFADSQYDTLAGIWDSTGFRGFDAGARMRSEAGWSQGGNGLNSIGFTAIPGGGAYGITSSFAGIGINAMFWTSIPESSANAMARFIDANEQGVYRGGFLKSNTFSIRCVKD